MQKVEFVIHGRPYAKKRVRFSRASGRAYDPKSNQSFEQQVGIMAMQHFNKPWEGPIRLTVKATFKVAKSWSKKKTLLLLGGWHTQKPDGDNICKAVMDGLNRIAWGDDAQVAITVVSKQWGDEDGTEVCIESLD